VFVVVAINPETGSRFYYSVGVGYYDPFVRNVKHATRLPHAQARRVCLRRTTDNCHIEECYDTFMGAKSWRLSIE
jgi:hypothetical protein